MAGSMEGYPLITDHTMPISTGDSLVMKLLELRPDIPIILTTGYSEQSSEEKAKVMGFGELLMKSVGLRALATTVRRVLDEGRSDIIQVDGTNARETAESDLAG
jgi:DNA-binding NtrC family response regulator